MSTDSSDLEAPDATFVKHRWIRRRDVEWVHDADKIMREYGAVTSSIVYDVRHKARWKAQRLIRLMVELRVHERWQLREHTDKIDGGWTWTVEYLREDK